MPSDFSIEQHAVLSLTDYEDTCTNRLEADDRCTYCPPDIGAFGAFGERASHLERVITGASAPPVCICRMSQSLWTLSPYWMEWEICVDDA